MKKLIIVESPAKIKTISKFLGSEYIIMSTVGHVKDLPRKKTGVNLTDKGVDIEYVIIENKDDIVADICKKASRASEIYLAPDPDREGEIIAWHIGGEIEKVVKDKSKIHRITFNEITKPAVTQALKDATTVNLEKVAAQQARRVLDRWVGYEVSPILWQKIAKGLSAGRVQSVALKLICDREQEIRDFKPQEYWSITGLFLHGKKSKLSAPLTHVNKKKLDLKSKKDTDKVLAELTKASYIVEAINDKERTKNPAAPFMTSTLQQTAYNRLGFSVKRTMQLAQNLYEGLPLKDKSNPVALITYMRTDSLRLSDTALKDARKFIQDEYSKEYLPTKTNVYAKGGKAQDAHEAVRPIDVSLTPAYVKQFIPADAAKLYDLIWKRFVACQMKPAKYAQRQIVIQGDKFTFKVTGSTLLFDGFLKVYGADEDDKEEKVVIPKDLKKGDAVDLQEAQPKQHFTQAPPRYTEASLVKELEKEGIGRPSTYAAIMNTIRQREYTEVDSKKRFIPSELGMTVVKMLTENFPQIMNVKFTAHMEEDLDKIASGELERDTLLRNFYTDFEKDVRAFGGPTVRRHSELTDIDCPECKEGKLAVRIGKSGHFVGCNRFPECNYTSNFEREDDGTIKLVKTEAPKMLEQACPQCGKPLRELVGRFGPFKACSGYPECKYIHQETAGFACPLDKGVVVKKVWKKGTMWGCKNYPKCKFAVFGDIEETPCPQCKSPFLVKKFAKDGSITLICNNKECGYKQEV